MSIHGIDKDGRHVRVVNADEKPSTSGPYYRDKDGWHLRVKGEVGEGVEGPQGPQGPEGPEGPQGPEGPAGKDAEPQFTQAQVDALLALIEPEE